MLRVARLAEKEVVVAIPETLLTRAKSGDASVSIWSEPGKRYVAKLRELNEAIDLFSAELEGDLRRYGSSAGTPARATGG